METNQTEMKDIKQGMIKYPVGYNRPIRPSYKKATRIEMKNVGDLPIIIFKDNKDEQAR